MKTCTRAMIIGLFCTGSSLALAQPPGDAQSFRVALVGGHSSSPAEQGKAIQAARLLGVENIVAFVSAGPTPDPAADLSHRSNPPVRWSAPNRVTRSGDLAVIGLQTSAVPKTATGVCTKDELAWLSDALHGVQSDRIFIAVNRAVWADENRREAWQVVHKVLAADTRVQAVLAVQDGIQRDDGVQDHIRYLGLPPSSGVGPRGLEQFSKAGIVLVSEQNEGLSLSVIDPRGVQAIQSTPGRVVDEAIALQSAVHLTGAFTVRSKGGPAGRIELQIKNPTSRTIRYALGLSGPEGWSFSRDQIAGTLAENESLTLEITAKAPEITDRPRLEVRGLLRLPLKNNASQTVPITLPVPVRPAVFTKSESGTPAGALETDGRSGVRVDLPQLTSPFTIECWAMAEDITGESVLFSSPGVQLNWSIASDLNPRISAALAQPHAEPVVMASAKKTPTEQWVHVALCVGSNSASLFLDGQLQSTQEIASRSSLEGIFVLGGVLDPYHRVRSGFTGSIDALRISSAVRYSEAFTPSRTLAPDAQTQVLMRFDQDLGPVFADDSGNELHGWRLGGPGRARVRAAVGVVSE